MYLAKKRGKNNYQFFIQEREDILERKIKLEQGLRRALGNNEFILNYQPKYELKTGKMKGLEALIRWNHPELGFVPPSEFIPIAEEVGMIISIGKWVIETACEQNKKWLEKGTNLKVAVNVSPVQFEGGNFHKMLKQILDEIELPPEFLEIEITEGTIQNLEVSSNVINELKKIGVKISLDDFGTGYSSLSVLNRLPIDYLKIDKSFVNEIASNCNSASLVKTIIGIGNNLKFVTIAEGIETEEQAAFLKQNGCSLGQGYLFSPPLTAYEIEKLIERQPIDKLSNH
jgi:EAL domain-containing protein (putative c-di-GMP-specific phosphodiesterase class I)